MDYIWMRAWGYALGSSSSYIHDEVARARQKKLPETVLFERNHPLSPDDPERHGASGVWADINDSIEMMSVISWKQLRDYVIERGTPEQRRQAEELDRRKEAMHS